MDNWETWVRTLANSTNPKDADLLVAKVAELLECARAEGRGVKENISKMKERAYEEGIARGRADEAIFCHDHKGGGFEAGRTAERARVREIFLWLLGYSDFPERKLGDGTYWWRKELRQKLKAIDLLEDLKVDN